MRPILSPIAVLAAATLLLAAPVLAGEIPKRWKSAWPKTDFTKIGVDPTEILSGGVPKDRIPAITDPVMGSVADKTELDDRLVEI